MERGERDRVAVLGVGDGGDRYGRGRHSPLFVAAAIVLSLILPPESGAVTFIRSENMRELAAGSSFFLPEGFLYEEGASHRAALSLEAASIVHYGIAGLRTDTARGAFRSHRFLLSISAARLSSPVGEEKMAGAGVCLFFAERMALRLLASYLSMHLDGLEGERSLALDVALATKPSRRIAVGFVASDLSRPAQEGGTFDSSLFIGLLEPPFLGVFGALSMSRYGEISPVLLVEFRPAAELALLFSYDTAAETLKGALCIGVGPLRVGFGAGLHPALGTTSGISVKIGE